MKITIDEIQKYFDTTINVNDRSMQLYTGERGMEIFHKQLQIANLEDMAVFLRAKECITKEQHTTLKEMLISKDDENFTLAKEIILIKSEEYGTTFRTKTS